MATGTQKQRTGEKTRWVRSRNCPQLRATFYRRMEECRDGEKVEEFAGTGAKSSIAAGGLSEPQTWPRESAGGQAVRSKGCRTRLDTKPSRGAAVA